MSTGITVLVEPGSLRSVPHEQANVKPLLHQSARRVAAQGDQDKPYWHFN
jgi:hypothetical protein